jgi:signal transduction histidine kinase
LTAPGAGAAGGVAADGGPGLAALWLGCYERLAAAAAHEVNNALNGVAMNLEVVRLRATPGGDAGLVAPFAAAAAAEHEGTVALAGALLALGRVPRDAGSADVGEVLGQAAALLAPALRHRGVALDAAPPGRPARTGAPARAVRLAVCATLDAAGAQAAAGGADRGPVIRCNVEDGDGPALVVAPGPPPWADDLRAALAEAGVRATWAPDRVRVAFPPQRAPGDAP